MARILMSGNELFDAIGAEGWTVFSGSPTTVVNQPGGRQTPQGNHGKHTFLLNTSIGLNQIAKTLPILATGAATGGYSEVYGRFAYNAFNSTAKTMFSLRNSFNGNFVGSIRMVDAGNPSFFIAVFNAAGTNLVQSALTKSVSTIISQPGAMTRVEFHFKCAASGGIWEIWVDDVLFLSNSALNTSNGATVVFDQIIIGQTEQVAQANGYDDIAINDLTGTVNNNRVGEGVILMVKGTREGRFSQLTNAFNTNKENYDHVNRPVTSYNETNNNSLYVGTNTPGLKDSYKMESLPAEIGGISALRVVANAVRNGAAITNAKLLLEPGVFPPAVAPTVGAPTAGGAGTAGDHQFVTVNKNGTGYSLPSPVSAILTLGAGNLQATLTVPVSTNPGITAREIYGTKANQGTTIAAGSNGQTLPQASIFVAANTLAASGTVYIVTSNGLELITYTGGGGTGTLTGCTGGSGLLSTGNTVLGPVFFIGVINDNTTTPFVFAIADASFGTLTVPVEFSSANIALPNGAFGGIENIFDRNTTTGLAWTHDEVEQIEAGLQLNV